MRLSTSTDARGACGLQQQTADDFLDLGLSCTLGRIARVARSRSCVSMRACVRACVHACVFSLNHLADGSSAMRDGDPRYTLDIGRLLSAHVMDLTYPPGLVALICMEPEVSTPRAMPEEGTLPAKPARDSSTSLPADDGSGRAVDDGGPRTPLCNQYSTVLGTSARFHASMQGSKQVGLQTGLQMLNVCMPIVHTPTYHGMTGSSVQYYYVTSFYYLVLRIVHRHRGPTCTCQICMLTPVMYG